MLYEIKETEIIHGTKWSKGQRLTEDEVRINNIPLDKCNKIAEPKKESLYDGLRRIGAY